MRRIGWIAGGIAVVGLAGFGGWKAFYDGAGAPAPSAETIALGESVYRDNCASCHGAERQGDPNWRARKPDGKLPAPPLDGSGHTWHHPDAQLTAVIAHGVEAMASADYKSDMKGFADRLSDTEIAAVLAYLKSKWPAEYRTRQQEITAQAAQ